MESREIVVKDIEIGPGPGGGASAPPRSGRPFAGLGRTVRRVFLVLLALALAIPAIVLGGACVIVALVLGLLAWALRRILGVRGGATVRVVGAGAPPSGEGRENVRVRP